MTASPTPRGTYRESDGTPVEFADALKVWTRITYERLLLVAQHYNGVVSVKQMAEHMQRASGIRTTMPASTVVAKVLELCAVQAARAGEPPLTSLCLRNDGTVGASYWKTPTADDIEIPLVTADADVEAHAAEHRLLCYRRYATDLPASGGVPRLPEQVVVRRERAARALDRTRAAQRETAPAQICPTCFTQLPASGRCWQCD